MFSFENGLQGWTAVDAALSQTDVGATDGTKALLTTFTGNFKNDVGKSGLITPTVNPQAFSVFSTAADEIAKGNRPNLEFDFTVDTSNTTTLGFGQLAVWVNSTGGYKDYGTGQLIGGNVGSSFPVIDALAASHGATLEELAPNQYRVSIPFLLPDETTTFNEGLTLAAGSHYFEMGFKANGGYDTITYAIDNIRFTNIPQFTSHTLFSWETPDNPATPSVNEAFEGWVTRNEVPSPPAGVTLQAGHAQSIVTTGASDGTKAYQIDRTSLPSGFTWGSQFGLSGVGNATTQARIDDLVSRVNGAAKVAFDVTYADQFPISPTFTNFFVHFADGTGAFYQAETAGIQINGAVPGSRTTLELPITAFDDVSAGSTKNLAEDGLLVGATFFEIGIATNTDGGAVYQIDNFRLLTEVPGLTADFNDDGAVDGEDLTIWEREYGPSGDADADGDGDSDGNDFLHWQREVGRSAVQATAAAIPEPSTWILIALAALAGCRRRR